jgi:hypothetical protein
MRSQPKSSHSHNSEPKKPTRKARMSAHMNTDAVSQAAQGQIVASDGTPTQDDWRELAQLIQKESDPHKMVELVQKLITRFDDEKLRKSPQTRAEPK